MMHHLQYDIDEIDRLVKFNLFVKFHILKNGKCFLFVFSAKMLPLTETEDQKNQLIFESRNIRRLETSLQLMASRAHFFHRRISHIHTDGTCDPQRFQRCPHTANALCRFRFQ